MLRDRPVSTSQTHAPVGEGSKGTPNLLTVYHPLIAVFGCTSSNSSEVRPRRWLGKELADQGVSRQHFWNEFFEKGWRAVLNHRRNATAKRGDVEYAKIRRHVVGGFMKEGFFVGWREPSASILFWPRS